LRATRLLFRTERRLGRCGFSSRDAAMPATKGPPDRTVPPALSTFPRRGETTTPSDLPRRDVSEGHQEIVPVTLMSVVLIITSTITRAHSRSPFADSFIPFINDLPRCSGPVQRRWVSLETTLAVPTRLGQRGPVAEELVRQPRRCPPPPTCRRYQGGTAGSNGLCTGPNWVLACGRTSTGSIHGSVSDRSGDEQKSVADSRVPPRR